MSAPLSEANLIDVLVMKPPGTAYYVAGLEVAPDKGFHLPVPEVVLFCSQPQCDGYHTFDAKEVAVSLGNSWGGVVIRDVFLHYTCRHCRQTSKVYAVRVEKLHMTGVMDLAHVRLTIWKIGEEPPFGPYTPPKVIKLIGPDRELFLKGRRAESQSLGIAAFAYYRRVVENQKDRLMRELIKVAELLEAPKSIIDGFKRMQGETQFAAAIGSIKPAVPESLLLRGHNPLTLLHSALSEGLHAETDEDCLEFAQHIRVILTELAERMEVVLAEKKELTESLSRLLAKTAAKRLAKPSGDENSNESVTPPPTQRS